MKNEAPPEGFVMSESRGPFTTHNGPVYTKREGAVLRHGFRALPRHCNGHGIAHGGWLAAFTDGVLGAAVWHETKGPSVTLRLNIDYLDMVRPGEWVEGTATVTRTTKSLAFARAELTAGGRKVLTAEALFKRMKSRPRS